MNKNAPLIKGLITGVLMVGMTLLFIYTDQAENSLSQYLFYALYAGGIAWTLVDYYRSKDYNPAFGSIFGQGFRCFIIITLITVIFTGVYSSIHPEIAEKAANDYRIELNKEGNKSNKTPAEQEEMVNNIKKRFVTGNISLTIFGALIIGTIFTAAGAGLLLTRRK